MKIILLSVIIGLHVSAALANNSIGLYFQERNYQKVNEIMASIQVPDSASVEDWALAAQSAEYLFNYQLSVKFWENVLVLDSTNLQAIEGAADGYGHLGNFNQALQNYNKVLRPDTTDIHFWAKYANVLSNSSRYDDAAKIYEKLFEINSENLFFQRKWAASVYQSKKYKSAIEVLVSYTNANPVDISMLTALVNCYQKLENDTAAMAVLQQIMDIDSTNVAALSKLAFIQFNNVRAYDQALLSYRLLNSITAAVDPVWLANQGICEYFAGDIEVAAKTLDSLSYVLTSNPFVYFYGGLSYLKLGNTERALQLIEIAAKLAVPAFTADIYHHLGRVYSQRRRFTDAIEAYSKVREINPANFLVLYDMALVYDESIRNSTAAVELYNLFLSESSNPRSVEYEYATTRIAKLREELFFEGN
jgi:tetratricopeptide (TPR) repeat protein